MSIFLAIYWNNHHHLMQTVERVSGGILWANMHLLFWLSLVPFTTGWMGENGFAPNPVALYGIVLLGAGIAYFILVRQIIARQGENSVLKKAIGKDFKGKASVLACALAIALSFYNQWVAGSLYVLVAMMWLIPDKRIEKVLEDG